MKTLFTSILIILLSFCTNIYKTEQTEFFQKCHDGYNTYVIQLQEEKSSYELCVVIGEYNSIVSYSILFNPSEVKEYKLLLKDLNYNRQYNIDTDGYGGFVIYNFVSPRDLLIEIQTRGKTTYSYELEMINLEQYTNQYKDQSIKGNNLGMELVKLNSTNKFTTITSIVFVCIILLSIIIILITYALKKGKFNPEQRNIEFEEEHKFRDQIREYFKEEEIIEVEAEEIKEQKKEFRIQEEFEERDISILLQNKGFNVDYRNLSVDQKNLVMLELMKMRDTKEITDEEYKSETIKLWM